MSYELTGYKWGDPVYGRGSGTITFGFDPSFYSALADDFGTIVQFEAAAEYAMETWAQVADIDFAPVVAGVEADLTIGFANLPGATIGQALTEFLPLSGVDRVISSIITLDSSEDWSPFGDAGLNFYNVVLHELGHSLGLDHPDGPGAEAQAMYEFYLSDGTIALADGDIAGIQLIYGAARQEILGTVRGETIDESGRTVGVEIFAFGGDDIVFGTAGDDRISGGSGDDRISGGSGDDVIADMTGDGRLQGDGGSDTIFAGIGNSRLEGGPGRDLLVGGTGNDTLVGGSSDDLLLGDPADSFYFGRDRLDGGTGDDLLTGGGGADVFVFRATGGADTIAEFGIDWFDPFSAPKTGQDFTPGLDRIEFETGTFSTAAEVYAATTTVGGSAVITFGSASLTIYGVSEAELSADSFIFGGAIA